VHKMVMNVGRGEPPMRYVQAAAAAAPTAAALLGQQWLELKLELLAVHLPAAPRVVSQLLQQLVGISVTAGSQRRPG